MNVNSLNLCDSDIKDYPLYDFFLHLFPTQHMGIEMKLL